MPDYKYVGGKWGGAIAGIPPRDLTDKEIAERGINPEHLDASHLYEKIVRRQKKTKEGK